MTLYLGNTPIAGGGIVDQTYDGTSTNAQSGVAINSELANYATTADLATKQDSATALTTTNTYYSGTTLYIG